MSITTMIRLPEWAGEELEKIADRKGLPFATVIREMVCEKLREYAPTASPAKMPVDAATSST